jgi:8-oxo-dGTP diphosphatase
MSHSNKVTGVTFVLTRPSGEILMQLRDGGRGRKIDYPNRWCFPGGHKEKDESYIEATVREIEEEYGIVLQAQECRLVLSYNYKNLVNNHVFLCKVGEDKFPHLLEGKGLCWMKMDEIKQLKLGFGQNRIIKDLENYIRTKAAR